jgi:hypothetical protein
MSRMTDEFPCAGTIARDLLGGHFKTQRYKDLGVRVPHYSILALCSELTTGCRYALVQAILLHIDGSQPSSTHLGLLFLS